MPPRSPYFDPWLKVFFTLLHTSRRQSSLIGVYCDKMAEVKIIWFFTKKYARFNLLHEMTDDEILGHTPDRLGDSN